jgi:hypothetical protein
MPNGNVRYRLKTPHRDGTTHVIFEPLDFIARLAALVPKPPVNLTRLHWVFAPNSKYRARVTPAKRDRGGRHATTADSQERTPAERRAVMTWAQRLKRVFGIDIETCPACGGAMRIIACIEDPVVIEKIFAHLDAEVAEPEAPRRPPPERKVREQTGGRGVFGCRDVTQSPLASQIDYRPWAQTDARRDCCGMKRRFILPISQVPVSKSSYKR